jgi:hypothetical protein
MENFPAEKFVYIPGPFGKFRTRVYEFAAEHGLQDLLPPRRQVYEKGLMLRLCLKVGFDYVPFVTTTHGHHRKKMEKQQHETHVGSSSSSFSSSSSSVKSECSSVSSSSSGDDDDADGDFDPRPSHRHASVVKSYAAK